MYKIHRLWTNTKWKKIMIHSVKIAIGSCLAILIAEQLHLEFASSAGIIALLSTVNTKWATVKLSIIRFFSFVMTVILSFVIFHFASKDWIAYGFFMFFLFSISSFLNWKDTVSVNAVAATHFLMTQNFSFSSVINEFLLVTIGVSVALFLNLFNDYKNQKSRLIFDMKYTEEKMQIILEEIAAYLLHEEAETNAWNNIAEFENNLSDSVERAYEYQDNTFHSHPGYYIIYFEMRKKQCDILHNLHSELKKIMQMPEQAKLIANYILYMKQFVKEHNVPESQLTKLHDIFEAMKKEPLPINRAEFESRAILYHILMDLEDFLIYKMRFIESLDERQKEIYWKEL